MEVDVEEQRLEQVVVLASTSVTRTVMLRQPPSTMTTHGLSGSRSRTVRSHVGPVEKLPAPHNFSHRLVILA
jgi:hypothetical protein